MGFVNIFSYDKKPEDFPSWLTPTYNFHIDEQEVKKKIFDLTVISDTVEILTVMVPANILSEGCFRCIIKQRDIAIKACSSKYACHTSYEAYYKWARCMVSRKLKHVKSKPDSVFVILYDKQHNSSRIERHAETILYRTNGLILTEKNDKSIPIIHEGLRFSNEYKTNGIVCCGNPIDWNHNYIGLNTRVLYRK